MSCSQPPACMFYQQLSCRGDLRRLPSPIRFGKPVLSMAVAPYLCNTYRAQLLVYCTAACQSRPLLQAQLGIVSLAQQQVSAVVVQRQHAFEVELCYVCIIYSGLCSCKLMPPLFQIARLHGFPLKDAAACVIMPAQQRVGAGGCPTRCLPVHQWSAASVRSFHSKEFTQWALRLSAVHAPGSCACGGTADLTTSMHCLTGRFDQQPARLLDG
jgi:hypothetical protein